MRHRTQSYLPPTAWPSSRRTKSGAAGSSSGRTPDTGKDPPLAAVSADWHGNTRSRLYTLPSSTHCHHLHIAIIAVLFTARVITVIGGCSLDGTGSIIW